MAGWSVDGSPTDAVSLAFLGYFDHGFDLVASGINYGANLGDDITYSGTVSAAMEAVINGCPAFAISQEYYEHPDFTLAGMAAAGTEPDAGSISQSHVRSRLSSDRPVRSRWIGVTAIRRFTTEWKSVPSTASPDGGGPPIQ